MGPLDPLAIGTALFLGASHALEVDHVVAVTNFVSRRPSTRHAAGYGIRWGVGHSVSVVALGTALLLLGVGVPERLEQAAELLVGVLLVAVGAWAIASARKLPGWGDHHQLYRERSGVLAVGIVHGVAGTGGVLALAPATMAGRAATGIGYLVLFSIGVIAAMTLLSIVAAGAMRRSGSISERAARLTVMAVGLVGVAVGVWWIARAAT